MPRSAQTTPFTVITGFLGAGKTTLLNHLLSAEHGHRLAVIVNEFGAINIDSKLVARRVNDGMLEMANGCVCCTVQQDLIDGLHQLLEGRRKEELGFDHIVLETTGLAKTGPIIQTIASNELRSALHLGMVVTVVDALHAPVQLDEHAEAQEQIGMADVVLLNKTDLVETDALETLSARLSRINAVARITHCQRAQVDAADLLRARTTSEMSSGILAETHDAHHDHSHDHDPAAGHQHGHTDHVTTFAVCLEEPLDHGRLQDWLSFLIMRYTERLLRYKGILNIDGRSSRVVLQGVHAAIEVVPGREWTSDEKRKTELVFIGRDLPEEDIRQGLASCIAARQP